MANVYAQHTQYVLLFVVLVVNFDWSQILEVYTLYSSCLLLCTLEKSDSMMIILKHQCQQVESCTLKHFNSCEACPGFIPKAFTAKCTCPSICFMGLHGS